MRIVEVNTVCDTGSTGRIAANIYRLAEKRGHEVYFAYGRGKHPEDINGYKIGNFFDFTCHVLINFFRGKSGFGSKYTTKKFLKWLDEIKPDILHLHNIHGFYINVSFLFEYIKEHNIRVVWTLHDCWSFTGQCAHFDYVGCDKWKTGCYKCPIYRSNYPYSLFCDNSKNNYKDKRYAFTGVNTLLVITPSNWLAELVKKSFLKEYKIKVVSNGIDLKKFCLKKEDSNIVLRNMHGIKENEHIILAVANAWTANKGLNFVYRLSNDLRTNEKIVIVGVNDRQYKNCKNKYGGRIIPIKRTSSIEEMVSWYQEAGVYINPTLEDTFPTTNIEALACGTPVVTFETGGSTEAIGEGCGMIVPKGNYEQLELAIRDVLKCGKKNFSNLCRYKALEYDKEKKFAEYVRVMEENR